MAVNFSSAFDEPPVLRGPATIISGGVTKDATPIPEGLISTTMSQAAYFKVDIEKLRAPDMYSNTILAGNLQNFLPVKSINYSVTSLEMTTIPVGIFGDMSIVTRKKLSKLNIVLLDNKDCTYEALLRNWYNKCAPDSGYVGYMQDIVDTLHYISYSTSGQPQVPISLEVMPADDMVISRDYDSNELKTISFSVIVVGSIGKK